MKPLLNISITDLSSYQIVGWGYTQELVAKSYSQFSDWIGKDHDTPISYLRDHRKELRESLKNYYPDALSAISFLFDYRESKKDQNQKQPNYKIASYVTGFSDMDYHFWISEKLNLIASKLKIEYPQLEFKISLDVHPVLERDLAFRSGLGWIGKNSMLINKNVGSFNLIGSLIFNQKLPLNQLKLEADHCGTCTACIDACPTDAIEKGTRTLIAKKCISYYTIEQFKDDSPAPKGYPTKEKEIFGCDICQDVCPWNKKSLLKMNGSDKSKDTKSKWLEFFNRDGEIIFQEIQKMSNKQFKLFFNKTSFERLGKKGLIKNLKHYL